MALGAPSRRIGGLGLGQRPLAHRIPVRPLAVAADVYGYGTTASTIGADLAGTVAGVWGDTNNGTAGVLATADSAEAIAAYNNSATVATLFVENQKDTTDSGIVLATYSDYGGYCDIFVSGNLICSGSVGGHASIP
ncbi:MAG: hypothetical protein ABSF64_37955, partial [Bryobacteraceae bacterium]